MAGSDTVARVRELLRARSEAATREAIRLAQSLVERDPLTPLHHLALADACRAAGERERAIGALARAQALGASAAEIPFNIGVLHAELDQPEAAIGWFERALQLRPDFAAALNNLGELFHYRGRLADAESAFTRALAVAPDYHVARFNLGMLLRDQGRLDDAERQFSTVLSADQNSRAGWVALAGVQRNRGRLDDAAQSLARAIGLDPSRSGGELTTLGSVLAERGDLEVARDAYRRALGLDSRNVLAALGLHLSLPQIYESVAHLGSERARYAEGLSRLEADFPVAPGGVPPDRALGSVRWCNFYLAYQGEDDRALQTQYADWLASYVDSVDPSLRGPLDAPRGRDRIRVGFASRFLANSTIGMYFGSWLEQLDRSRFEVVLIDFAGHRDQVASAIAASADGYRVLYTRGRPIREIAAAIRAEGLDILVYPELGMDDVTFLLASLRLAPVQCCAWGHPVTSGHSTIDYFLTPSSMEPPEGQGFYRERLLELPGLGTFYPKPPSQPPASRADVGLPDDALLFLCPQSLFKIHPETDDLLREVLAKVPHSRLVLFEGKHPLVTDRFMRRLAGALAARGMDARERCIVLPAMPRADYLRITSSCDVVLDTLHWSGGNTSLDALACGLPIVTLPGRFMRGRQSMAMLQMLDLPELVAGDPEQYVHTAIELATDAAKRLDLRETIRRRTERLFEDRAPIRALEARLEEAFAGAR